MRVRETILFQNTATAQSHDRSNCAGSFSNNDWSYPNLGLKRITDCVLTHSQLELAKSGGVLPYLPVEITTQQTEVKQTLSYTVTKTSAPSCILSYGTWILPNSLYTMLSLPSLDSAIISYVVNSAIASAKAESFDALTAAAELKRTSDMIANRMRRIFDIADLAAHRARKRASVRLDRLHKSAGPAVVRDANRAKLRETVKHFNQAWLELRYGWRPLVYDISGACSQMLEKPHLTQRGRNVEVVDLGGSSSKITDGSIGRLTCTCARTGTRTYRGYALARGVLGTAPEFRPFQTAWELVPFSFVVDWFFDVGSFIAAATPIPGVDILASGYSVHDSWNLVQESSASLKPGVVNHTVVTNTVGRTETTEETYTRSPSGVLSPRLYPRLNTLKLVDIAALVFQRAAPLRGFLHVR